MAEKPSIPAQSVPEKPRNRKWFRKLFVFSVLLAVVVALIPPLVGSTSLRNRIVPHLWPQLAQRVSLGSASLGWFSPIGIDNLNVYDHDGTVMLQADRLQSRYTLLDLILEPSDLGEWILTRATTHLTIESDTSNLEDFLNLLATDEDHSPYSLTLKTENTPLSIVRKGSENSTQFQLSRFVWEHTKQNQGRFAGEIVSQPKSSGSIDFDLTSSDRWEGFVKILQWDCSTLEPLAVRLGKEWQLKGKINEADLLVSPQIEATLNISDLFVGENELPLADLRSLAVGLQISSTTEGRLLKQLNCQSEFGTLALDGEILVPEINENSGLSEFADRLLAQKFSLAGEFKLAELANRLPGLLKIREGVVIDGGRLKFLAQSIPAEKVLETSLTVSDLNAAEASRTIRWDNPFEASGRLRKTESIWQLEDLSVTSPGIAIHGTGNLNEADFSANIDLTKFQTEWSRVLNTANWTARGTLEGTFSSRQAGPNRYQLAGQAKGQNISLGTSGSLPWEFPELKTTMSGTVLHDQHLTLETLSFDLETDKEQLSAQKKPDGIWNLSASGNLDGVATHLLSLSPTDRITGRYRLGTQFQSAASLKRFNDLKLTIEDLVWSSGTRRVDEQQLIVEGNLSYSSQSGSIEIPGLTLNSATVAARLTDARFERNTDRPSFAGQLAARGRLERIVPLLGIDSKNAAPNGLLNLQLKSTRNSDQTTDFRWKMFTEGLDWNTAPKRLPTHAVSWTPSAESTPDKSEMTFGGAGQYLPSEQRIELTESEFDAGFLQLNLAGQVTELNTAPLLKVSGKCDYDWSILRRRFPDLFDPEFDIRGEHSSPVTLSIPLNTSARHNMSGTIPIQWESASWSGLAIGPGRTDAVLSASRIDVQPLKTSVAGGTVRLSPAVIFSDRGTVVEQTPETIFDQVHLSEEICQNWLKYVSPLTADASRVEGTFSLETSKLLHFPLADKKSATGTGVLQIHSARMSPGPLAMQIVTLEKQIEAIRKGTPFAGQANADPRAVLTIRQQVVPFEIKDNRVTHRDLKMKIKDLDIRTSGSVGFDESLDLTVEMEIPPSWTIQGKRLRDIWGASIQIPIRGSLKKPLADPRFVDALLKQLLKGSATNFLENQFNKQLNNLFGPKK